MRVVAEREATKKATPHVPAAATASAHSTVRASAQVMSDIGVCIELFRTGNPIWGSMATTLLLAQYVVVYWRALEYLKATKGVDSDEYKRFRWFGLPFGVVARRTAAPARSCV